MNKRLQVILTPESWTILERVHADAVDGFRNGSINISDVINEMILVARVDIKGLRLKHTDLKRSLLAMAKTDDVDVDQVIKTLTELRARGGKRQLKMTFDAQEKS